MTTAKEQSSIRDLKLSPEGERKIGWVRDHMPILRTLEAQFKTERPFAGKRVTICLHLEAKTAYMARVVQAGGAQVAVTASNPLSTQDDVVAALVEGGIHAYAWHGATDDEYHAHIRQALDFQPDALIDDGGDLVTTLHAERPSQLGRILGGCEETTTGLVRLRAMAQAGQLKFPMIAVNDAYSKYLFDNRYGTGQSVWDGIMRTTNLVVAGKTVVVVGFGWCGKGVAMRAKGLGARVVVCEIDPIRATEAVMEGYAVMPLLSAAAQADYIITVTGNRDCVTRKHFEVMKDGAILANAGHFDVEINKVDLGNLSVSRRESRRNVEEFVFADGRKVYLLAEGRLVNLAAGDGHPAEVMDMSFGLQVLALRYVVEQGRSLTPQVHPVPTEIDKYVARLRLASWGIAIDELSEEQSAYLNSWNM